MRNSIVLLRALAIFACAVAPTLATAQSGLDPHLPIYRPVQQLNGELKLAGSNTMSHVASVWANDFRQFYPDVKISIEVLGSRNAVTAVQDGKASFGLLSRQIEEEEVAAFQKKFGYEPKVLTPCFERIAVYVNKDNPVEGMTMSQLDAIYSTSLKRGAEAPIKTWKQLGVPGALGDRPITVHGREPDTGSQVFFQDLVLLGGAFRKDIVAHGDNLEMVVAVGKDPSAIGFAGRDHALPDVRTAPLAVDSQGPYVSVDSSRHPYPLVRPLQLVVNVGPDDKLGPVEKEFIKFVFSRLGQEGVIKAGFNTAPVQSVNIALDSVGLGVAR